MRQLFLYCACFLALRSPSIAQFVGGDNGGTSQFMLTQSSCSNTGASPFYGGNQGGYTDLTFVNSTCNANGLTPFAGANGDGNADQSIVTSACIASGVSPFYGGSEDGHSESFLIQNACNPTGLNPFYGGNEDGHSDVSLLNGACIALGANPFTGGSQDGHSDLVFITNPCSALGLNPFSGGTEDGHADVTLLNSSCSSTGPNPFYGGQEDGHSDLVLTVITCNVALPVQVLFFNAQCESGRVELNWATGSEKDNDYFIVERSDNLDSFKRIAKINGKGNSNSLEQYNFTDINPGKGDVLYRLSQVDYDGRQEFLQTLTSNCEKPSQSSISPNPNNGHFLVFGTENLEQISIYNSLGDLVFQDNLSGTMNEINISALASGVYYVVTQSDFRNDVIKMVIAK
jgi:hypothetical protein